jgi:hypothetical protein
VIVSWAVRGGSIGDWWDVVDSWSPDERHRALIGDVLTAGPEFLTQVLRGGVGAQLNKLGLAVFSEPLRDALVDYLAAAPFDVVGRVLQLCLLDVGAPFPASAAFLRQLDHWPPMVRHAVRRELLSRPRSTARVLVAWFANGGFLGLDEPVLGMQVLPDEVLLARGEAALDDYRSLLLGQLAATGEGNRLRRTLREPASRLLRLLRRRALTLSWSGLIPSSTWNIALEVLVSLVGDEAGVAWGHELAASMYACIEVVRRHVSREAAQAALDRQSVRVFASWPWKIVVTTAEPEGGLP